MTQHLPNPYRREADIVADRLAGLGNAVDWPAAARTARPWVDAVRKHPPPFWAMESLLKEYPIASASRAVASWPFQICIGSCSTQPGCG